MSPLSGEAQARKEYLDQFSRAQQIRTQRYKQLEKGFDAVLQTHDESQYKYVKCISAALLFTTVCMPTSSVFAQNHYGRSDSSI